MTTEKDTDETARNLALKRTMGELGKLTHDERKRVLQALNALYGGHSTPTTERDA